MAGLRQRPFFNAIPTSTRGSRLRSANNRRGRLRSFLRLQLDPDAAPDRLGARSSVCLAPCYRADKSSPTGSDSSASGLTGATKDLRNTATQADSVFSTPRLCTPKFRKTYLGARQDRISFHDANDAYAATEPEGEVDHEDDADGEPSVGSTDSSINQIHSWSQRSIFDVVEIDAEFDKFASMKGRCSA